MTNDFRHNRAKVRRGGNDLELRLRGRRQHKERGQNQPAEKKFHKRLTFDGFSHRRFKET